MDLDRVLGGVDLLESVGDLAGVNVRAVDYDSRRAGPGSLFCCIPGARADGHEFAPKAVAAGAVALLCERVLDLPVPQARVREVRPAMARAAAALAGHPSRRLTVIGVTGTNGKTTVTYLLRSVLEAAGRPTALIGTLSGARTTPEAPDLQSALAGFLDGGVSAVAMEVSSHALSQHRVDGVEFAAAVFTNLSHEHLDYHGTMDSYFAAKASLFDSRRTKVAVVNASDPWGRMLVDRLRAEDDALPVVTFSDADASELEVGLDSATFKWRRLDVRIPLGGGVNVVNALAAATTAAALGLPDDVIAAGLARVPAVPGRMEVIDAGQPFGVIVDYAHTPDGLERVLTSAHQARPGGRVAVVFGCGGGRDRAKRPLMGEVASRLADLAVLTSDNPRNEDPAAIIDEVESGAAGPGRMVVEADRRAAIARAIEWARPGDVVVVAGKGHETGQEIGGRVIPFDDRAVSRQLLDERRRGTGAPA